MIPLHRFSSEIPFLLNPDLVVTIEATPDTMLTLATGAKVVVTETPDEIVAAIADWRAQIATRALRGANT